MAQILILRGGVIVVKRQNGGRDLAARWLMLGNFSRLVDFVDDARAPRTFNRSAS